ncbi:uncharacterized protein LOC133442086 [Cololabis saira]|uniref:uncharacterized protein LOC133442086 n=1 Tax=Cololabis saira TaxID=129043 RepID=UPI002AD49DD2|nr:uncharacterized protein LOC133442086 [Cololabis saira]
MDQDEVDWVEKQTRGQRTNPDWFDWRRNRITASLAHDIDHCRFVNGKSSVPPASYLAEITGEGPRFQTRAMRWGVKMEAWAVRRYQELKSEVLGRQVQVQDCGLFIDPQNPWLAASPDRIVTDRRRGRQLVLEVKCPFKHRHSWVEDACEDRDFCLEIQGTDEHGEPVYGLKTSHRYFTQVQVQMAVTGLQRADLVVFTLWETVLVPVNFNAEWWEETLPRLDWFYRVAVLPHIQH